MIGKRIGDRYEIIRGIGEGGMSKVYLAHDVILDRQVAIKVLTYDFANEEELKRRFQREALSATSLTHPHIVNIFDVGEEDELHYLVMEYVEGQTLKKYILENGPLSPAQAVPIMQQLVAAIANAHHNGIIHRDIKPQNILMDTSGQVKITDFGIAMALNATVHTKTNSVIGTVHYLSPEQARGGLATKKSDLYSLGIVFYELLTGQLPFSAETAVAIALKHLQEETPSVKEQIPSIPQSVENVILKSTAKDPMYRYQSADEMYEDLLTVLSPERANEEKFTIPYHDDETKKIPIVNDQPKFIDEEETKKIEPVQVTANQRPALKKKRRKWPLIVGLLLTVIVLFVVLLMLFMPKQATIPNVVGLEKAEASELIEKEGFTVKEWIEESSDEVEVGRVIRTLPESDKKREVGTPIVVYISTGKETRKLDDYTGRSYEQMKELLEGYGFTVELEEVFSDQPIGQIVEQKPAPNEEVVPDETVIVFQVSKGSEKMTVDSLQGYSEQELTAYLKDKGFNIRIVKEVESDTVPKGQVVSQSPSAGSKLERGGTIEVVLSKGKAPSPVKWIVETVTIPYKPATSSVNEEGQQEQESEVTVPQKVDIYIQDNKRSMNHLYKSFEITEDTTEQLSIELKEGQRGGYKIVRDDVPIEEKMIHYDDIE